MHKLLWLGLIAGVPLAADDTVPAPQVQAPVDCSNLNQEEQTFANQLTDWTNRSVFCARMNQEQRKGVMELTKNPNAQGVLMTPDEALVLYIKQNYTGPAAVPQRKPSGCPGGS